MRRRDGEREGEAMWGDNCTMALSRAMRLGEKMWGDD